MIILDVTTQAKPGTMAGGSLAGMIGIWNIGRVGRICIRNQSVPMIQYASWEYVK